MAAAAGVGGTSRPGRLASAVEVIFPPSRQSAETGLTGCQKEKKDP